MPGVPCVPGLPRGNAWRSGIPGGPDEDAGPDVLGNLELCLYGFRDAAKGWQETLSAQLGSCGFRRGVGHPAVFWHPDRDIMTVVHGDDYVSSGRQTDLDWMEIQLQAAYEIQKLELDVGCVSEGKVLNRIVRCNEDGWSLEADPRHAELIIEQVGVSEMRSAATPGIDGIDEVDREDDVEITGPDATRFRGVFRPARSLTIARRMPYPTTS